MAFRAHFLEKYGTIVDNELVGQDLREVYWTPGNSEQFMTLVERLTGKPLSGDAWVDMLEESTDSVLVAEKEAYDAALVSGPKFASGESVDLDMRVKLVHGDTVVADTSELGGLFPVCERYKAWLSSLSEL